MSLCLFPRIGNEDISRNFHFPGGRIKPKLPIIAKANSSEVKAKLRAATAEAKTLGICGVPTYRILRQNHKGDWAHDGNIVWGQDETNVVQDLIAGWDAEASNELAEPRKPYSGTHTSVARL